MAASAREDSIKLGFPPSQVVKEVQSQTFIRQRTLELKISTANTYHSFETLSLLHSAHSTESLHTSEHPIHLTTNFRCSPTLTSTSPSAKMPPVRPNPAKEPEPRGLVCCHCKDTWWPSKDQDSCPKCKHRCRDCRLSSARQQNHGGPPKPPPPPPPPAPANPGPQYYGAQYLGMV